MQLRVFTLLQSIEKSVLAADSLHNMFTISRNQYAMVEIVKHKGTLGKGIRPFLMVFPGNTDISDFPLLSLNHKMNEIWKKKVYNVLYKGEMLRENISAIQWLFRSIYLMQFGGRTLIHEFAS